MLLKFPWNCINLKLPLYPVAIPMKCLWNSYAAVTEPIKNLWNKQMIYENLMTA